MTKIIWTNGETEYEIVGLFGCWAKSKESNAIEKGAVRLIAGELMYAYSIERTGLFSLKCDTVNWVSVREKVDMEEIRTWKARLL